MAYGPRNMANKAVHLPVLNFGSTLRKDNWWVGPVVTGAILISFITYATFRAFENNFYEIGPYLSPFYSPFFGTSGLGIPFLSPAMLILPGPASFRLTCYYYRKAYYRAFAMDPVACAVGERNPESYKGETRVLLFQNLHRYTMYVAVIFLGILWYDAIKSMMWTAPDGGRVFHIGVGTLVMVANCTLLSLYTFGCHSFRHLIGGGVDSFSTAPLGKLRYAIWTNVSKLNGNHMLFAWMSLFGVALTDLYIRSIASGAFADVRIL
jgi:hypothetical protein